MKTALLRMVQLALLVLLFHASGTIMVAQHVDMLESTGLIDCGANRIVQWGKYPRVIELPDAVPPLQLMRRFGSYCIDANGTVFAWYVLCRYHFPEVDSFGCAMPRRLALQTSIRNLSADDETMLYVDVDGVVWAAGRNERSWFMGTDTPSVVFPPRVVPLSGAVTAVEVGSGNIVALMRDGTVWTWGANQTGQAGTNDSSRRPPIRRVESLANIRAVRSLFHDRQVSSVFAITEQGELYGWGYNRDGNLGDGTREDRYVPVYIAIDSVVDVKNGGAHTVALRADGSVWTWGDNELGQLGLGHDTAKLTPQRVPSLSNIRSIHVGVYCTIAIDANGAWWGWGYDHFGLLPGVPIRGTYHTPVRCTSPCMASSINEAHRENERGMVVSPQPASTTLHVRLAETMDLQASTVDVVDLLGMVVASHTAERQSLTIDVSSLPVGIYVLRCRNDVSKQSVAPFWVMR